MPLNTHQQARRTEIVTRETEERAKAAALITKAAAVATGECLTYVTSGTLTPARGLPAAIEEARQQLETAAMHTARADILAAALSAIDVAYA